MPRSDVEFGLIWGHWFASPVSNQSGSMLNRYVLILYHSAHIFKKLPQPVCLCVCTRKCIMSAYVTANINGKFSLQSFTNLTEADRWIGDFGAITSESKLLTVTCQDFWSAFILLVATAAGTVKPTKQPTHHVPTKNDAMLLNKPTRMQTQQQQFIATMVAEEVFMTCRMGLIPTTSWESLHLPSSYVGWVPPERTAAHPAIFPSCWRGGVLKWSASVCQTSTNTAVWQPGGRPFGRNGPLKSKSHPDIGKEP